MADPRDIQRLIGDLARLGTVVSVDLTAATARVQLGEIVTGDLPWLALRAGATRIWSAPSVGEQVLVLCPEADAEAGLIIGSLPCNRHPAPSDTAETLIHFADGARILYDPEAHLLDVSLPEGARAIIAAPGGIRLVGPVTIEGTLAVSRTVTAEDDVVAAGKSLKGHRHLGVQPGSGISGTPQ